MEVLPLLTGSEEQGPQQLDLKPLPIELKYAFLGGKLSSSDFFTIEQSTGG